MSNFQVRVVALPPGGARSYDEADWGDALVLVERGEIELESLAGRCASFKRGDVLWLIGLPLRTLHNRGAETVLLVAVSRAGDEFPADPRSYLRTRRRGDRT